MAFTMTNHVTLFFLAAAAGIVTSMPTSSPDIRDISATATQACPAVENNESEHLNVFHAYRLEAIDLINTILHNNSQWINVMGESKGSYCAEKTDKFSAPVADHDRLSDVQASDIVRQADTIQMLGYFKPSGKTLRTGHCKLRVHLHRMGLACSTMCGCGAPKQSPKHVVQDCKDFAYKREENLRLHALLQMSNYAHFLKSEDSTTDYGDATSKLHDLWKKINNIVSTLGHLLPSVTCDDITLYTEEDVSGHVITAPQTTQSDKRSFCYCVLEVILTDCQSWLTSFEANTMNV